MIVAYVSGHGFGHATRTAEVLRVVRELDAAVPITVVSAAPASLFEDVIEPPLRVRRVECDVGLAQRDALTIDEAGTLERWARHLRGFGELAASESQRLRAGHARVVLGDVPPLAFVAAAEAGVSSFALANFSWDWIYRHLSRRSPELSEAADFCAAAYASCDRLLRLPFAGDMSAFTAIEDVPLVARLPKQSRVDARQRLGLPSGRLVLLSFGGLGLPGFDPTVLAPLAEYHFCAVGDLPSGPPNLTVLERAALRAAGVGYEDVVGAADCVVTKPGYGIVSDAIGAGTPIVYTERGDFPEFPILVRGMAQYVPAAHVSNADLRAGRLREPLAAVIGASVPARPPMNGARVVAELLLGAAA
jgi:hypothetical protein